MEHNNTSTPMARPPAAGHPPMITVNSQPPQYQDSALDQHKEYTLTDSRQDREMMPAPAPAFQPNNTVPYPTEKPVWNPAAQPQPAPTGQPQNFVVQRAVELNQLNEEPRLVSCPFCYRETMTRVEQESTDSTTMASIGCCILGGLCFAWLPFYLKMCHDSHHFCSNCGQKIAIRPHEGEVQAFSPQHPAAMPPRPVQQPQAAAMSNAK